MNCRACDKPIEGGWAKWCGPACYAFSRRNPGETRPGPRLCENCGQSFQPATLRSVFCSSFCGEVARGARVYGPHGMVITCAICGEKRAVPKDYSRKAMTCLGCRGEWATRRGRRWRTDN